MGQDPWMFPVISHLHLKITERDADFFVKLKNKFC